MDIRATQACTQCGHSKRVYCFTNRSTVCRACQLRNIRAAQEGQ